MLAKKGLREKKRKRKIPESNSTQAIKGAPSQKKQHLNSNSSSLLPTSSAQKPPMQRAWQPVNPNSGHQLSQSRAIASPLQPIGFITLQPRPVPLMQLNATRLPMQPNTAPGLLPTRTLPLYPKTVPPSQPSGAPSQAIYRFGI